jgi:PAS domain S-box-containing protein
LDALAEAGGLDSLMIESGDAAIEQGGRQPFSIASLSDEKNVVEARLLQVPWDGESAFALLTMPPSAEPSAQASLAALRAQLSEVSAILDTATDGVVVLDRAARILSANRSAQALFGYDAEELEGRSFGDLFAPESIGAAIDYLDRVQSRGVAALLNDGSEVIGRERLGGLIPLFMTMGRLGDEGDKYCAVFRDITPWKTAEEELIAARRDAERASSAKSDFLAKISHEIRTPLNAIIGFSEVMTEERFGPIGNERYRQYLKDIHASGAHLISLINDLLDLSKIEAGKLELTIASVSINDLTQQCVAIMQPQANRERIIIRTSLSPRLPQVLADARSVRQIVLNLLSNSIKFTVAGGQVIVSTAVTDTGEVVLRVRDTGIGMSDKDIATALEPFRQVATATRGRSGGTGLGLQLTKALAEANHATFHIKSAPNEGTLVEIAFPGARLLAAQ